MIGVAQLLYDIDLTLNKVATSWHQSIPLEDKIIALNTAQIKLIKDKLYARAPQPAGLDAFKRRYEDLQNLVQPHQHLAVQKDNTSGLAKFLVNLEPVIPKYMFYVDCYLLCTKGACGNVAVTAYRIKHADLQPVLANANTCPSFEYRQLPITTSDNLLEIYTDGSFTPTDAFLSYVRYPEKIDMEGYLGFDGTPSVTRDSELADYLQDELVDLAVQQLAMNTENQSAAQYAAQRIQNNP